MVRKVAQFQLSSARIFEILSDPNFYGQCPLYFFMRRQGETCAKRYIESALQNKAVPKESFPALATFVNITSQAFQEDPELLRPLREYLEARLGYPVEKVSLYYKHQGEPQEVSF